MRKILITIAIVAGVAAMSIGWIFNGRPLSLYLDRFKTIEMGSAPINSMAYEGSGTGGILFINDLRLSVSRPDPHDPPPNIGTTKDDQLGLSFGGKVFAFGPIRSKSENGSETLATEPQPGDDASIEIRRGVLSWIEPFNFNFMTGQSPSWKRHLYYQLTWKRQSGARLEMVWRYEQYFYPANGWASGFMTREGSTGLIRVDIQR